MKIRMLASFSGPDLTVSPGDITDAFSKSDAAGLIAAGYAELPPAEIKTKGVAADLVAVQAEADEAKVELEQVRAELGALKASHVAADSGEVVDQAGGDLLNAAASDGPSVQVETATENAAPETR